MRIGDCAVRHLRHRFGYRCGSVGRLSAARRWCGDEAAATVTHALTKTADRLILRVRRAMRRAVLIDFCTDNSETKFHCYNICCTRSTDLRSRSIVFFHRMIVFFAQRKVNAISIYQLHRAMDRQRKSACVIIIDRSSTIARMSDRNARSTDGTNLVIERNIFSHSNRRVHCMVSRKIEKEHFCGASSSLYQPN